MTFLHIYSSKLGVLHLSNCVVDNDALSCCLFAEEVVNPACWQLFWHVVFFLFDGKKKNCKVVEIVWHKFQKDWHQVLLTMSFN